MKTNKIFILKKVLSTAAALIALFATQSLAKEPPPSWIEAPPEDDSNYQYYVGRGPLEVSEKLAIDSAMDDALTAAVLKNFGLYVKVVSESTESLKETSQLIRKKSDSSAIQFRGVERLKVWVEQTDDMYAAHVLIRYNLKAVKDESKRLEESARSGTSRCAVKITSEPSGAEVLINGGYFGKTPMTINDNIPAGTHRITIKRNTYESHDESILMIPGACEKIHRKLKPIFTTVTIHTTPPGADITVNGTFWGESPVTKSQHFDSSKIEISVYYERTKFAPKTEWLSGASRQSFSYDLPGYTYRVPSNRNPPQENTTTDLAKKARSLIRPGMTLDEAYSAAGPGKTVETCSYMTYVNYGTTWAMFTSKVFKCFIPATQFQKCMSWCS